MVIDPLNSRIGEVFILLWLPYGAWTRVARWLVRDVSPREVDPINGGNNDWATSHKGGPTLLVLDRRQSLELRWSQPPEDPPAYDLAIGHTWMSEVEMSCL